MNKPNPILFLILLLSFALSQVGMARKGQYDEEAREAERVAKTQNSSSRNPVKNVASGIKEATVDSAASLVNETAEGASSGSPIVGTLEGARKGTGKVLDRTVKGAVKVATLGYADTSHYEVQEPESGKDEPTKFKFKF